jgi:hypothetical protein
MSMPPCVNEQSASYNDDRITCTYSFLLSSLVLVLNRFDALGASSPFPFSLSLSHLGGPTACRSSSLVSEATPTLSSFDRILVP